MLETRTSRPSFLRVLAYSSKSDFSAFSTMRIYTPSPQCVIGRDLIDSSLSLSPNMALNSFLMFIDAPLRRPCGENNLILQRRASRIQTPPCNFNYSTMKNTSQAKNGIKFARLRILIARCSPFYRMKTQSATSFFGGVL